MLYFNSYSFLLKIIFYTANRKVGSNYIILYYIILDITDCVDSIRHYSLEVVIQLTCIYVCITTDHLYGISWCLYVFIFFSYKVITILLQLHDN